MFVAPDFEYTGNTNNVQHLIASANQANRHPTNLNFELNLRTYVRSSTFLGQQAWEYPKAPSVDPVAVDKPAFGHAHQLRHQGSMLAPHTTKNKHTASENPLHRQDSTAAAKRQSMQPLCNYLSRDPEMPKYHIKYRVKNVSELKGLLTRQSNQPTIAWQASLRPNLGNNATFVTSKTIPKRCVSTLNNAGKFLADDRSRRACQCSSP